MKKYELMLIINPELSEQELNDLISEIKEELGSASINIIKEDLWGTREMAYKINNSLNGYYVLYDLESDGKSFFNITKSFNIKKNIWRHMFTKIED